MVRKGKILEKFEKDLMKRTKPDYKKNLKIFDELYKEARILGKIPAKNPLEGIEVQIRIARILNSRGK